METSGEFSNGGSGGRLLFSTRRHFVHNGVGSFSPTPIEYFDKDFLLRLGNCIGKAVKVDVPSSKSERGKFARVCVQLDLTQSLISKVTVRSLDYCVEYEGLHSICFECGKYGHQKDTCPNLVVSKPQNTDMGGTSGGTSEPAAGSKR
ncbi:hypothetical protein Vadar_028636 [Vaccinium darrowii]|uniref:Uncharacterized protein n=1 Tax=Vaccinium darrowii TaxID=229202 RepID=A0ACB7ZNA1_9ERIC|nr:hypothetical protein Vadar_028636 [Vaccinium darrowii]